MIPTGTTDQHEDQLGQDPLIKDLPRRSRTSTAFVYADTSMVKDAVTQSENFLALNSNVFKLPTGLSKITGRPPAKLI